MSFAKKHNKGTRVFDIDLDGREFFKLKDLFEKNGADKVYKLDGLYISKSKNPAYPDSAVLFVEDYLVNAPSYMTEMWSDVLADQEDIEAIKAGTVLFKISTYIDKTFKKTCYGMDFIDKE